MINKRELESILKELHDSYSEAFDYNGNLYTTLKQICEKYDIRHKNIVK